MNIAIICPFVYPLLNPGAGIVSSGGAEAQLKVIGFELADHGHNVSYVVNDYGQADFENIHGVSIYKSSLDYMGGSNKSLPVDWIKLWQTLTQIDADIYILKLPRHILSLVGLFCTIKGKKLVFIGQINQDVDLDFIRKNEGFFAFWMYRIGIKFVNHVVAQNSFQQQGFTDVLGKSSTIIKNALTLEEALIPEVKPYILWVGNTLQKKQPKLFLDLAKALPQYKFRMILAPAVGGAEKSIAEKAKAISNLEYIGFVPMSDIATHYAGAAVFISTSLREGFPNTFLQAWQHKTPVVSLHVDPDQVISSLGLGVVSGDFDKLCSDVSTLMDDKEGRITQGLAGKSYVEQEHELAVCVKRYEAIFSDLIET